MLQGEELINRAYIIALKAHEGQYRRDGKTPYINHPLAVADQFENPILLAIALLHDVLEDTDVTKKELLEKGIPEDIVIVVDILTKRENEKYLEYILRIKDNVFATLVKIEDIKHNYTTAHKSKQERYELALYILKGEK